MTRTLPTSRAIGWHESHHCASLILDGMVPLHVRIDYPTADLAGVVRCDWNNHDINEHTMRCLLVATLLGPISESEPVYLHTTWPIRADEWQDGCQADARQIAFIAQWLGLDQVHYLRYVCDAGRRAKTLDFRRLVVAIAHALERCEVLMQPELVELADTVLA